MYLAADPHAHILLITNVPYLYSIALFVRALVGYGLEHPVPAPPCRLFASITGWYGGLILPLHAWQPVANPDSCMVPLRRPLAGRYQGST